MQKLARTFVVGAVSILAFATLSQVSAHSADGLTCHGHAATIVTQPGVYDVVGTPGPDVVVHGDEQEAHSIVTFAGDDIVCGLYDDVDTGDGDDAVYGNSATVDTGEGNDAVYGGGDYVYTGPGDDTVRGDGFGAVLAGPGADRIIAPVFSYSLHGDEGNDYILSGGSLYGADGGEGNDIVTETNSHFTGGGPGDDIVRGGTASLNGSEPFGELSGGTGNDRVIAGPTGEWTLWDSAGLGNDRYVANGNPDVRVSYTHSDAAVRVDLGRGIARGQGNDTLVGIRGAGGGRHADVIIGDGYANRIFGLIEGSDDIFDPSNAGADIIKARGGDDYVNSLGTDTQVWGEDGNDTINAPWANGGNDDDTIYAPWANGGYGNDTIYAASANGGYGNDTLFGVSDFDILIGGPGIDSATDTSTTDHDTCIAETTTGCEVTHL